uniref:Uncharacterized protein n=1 Tax=viral metagenome TaxID=1070528 RepID=A0A6C0EET4_9ZZZZ
MNYRWALVNRELDPNILYNIKETINLKSYAF